ncbi:MAG: extracellular solute-binding protein [Chloroflexota bacterium]
MSTYLSINRRGLLRVGGLAAAGAVAACAPTVTAPAPAPVGGAGSQGATKAAWEKDWDDLVAAAKKEGPLVLVTNLGPGFKDAAAAFEKAFPGVTVELITQLASAFAPKAVQERQAGVYSYDVTTQPNGTVPLTLIPAGAMDPIRPLIVRPDILDDKSWRGGFEAGFPDKDKKWGYAGFQEVHRAVWINTDLIKEGEIKTFDDLLNPKWKGKIVGGDPRTFGGGWWPGTTMRLKRSDDSLIKRLFKDQEVAISRDSRQQIEFLIKGSYPIGILASTASLLPEFLAQGVGKNIKWIPMDEMDNLNGGISVAFVFNKAPHPNAAKLFVNWLLTKEGYAVWSKAAGTNSRRTDVPPTDPQLVPTPGMKLIAIDRDEFADEWRKTQELAKQSLG